MYHLYWLEWLWCTFVDNLIHKIPKNQHIELARSHHRCTLVKKQDTLYRNPQLEWLQYMFVDNLIHTFHNYQRSGLRKYHPCTISEERDTLYHRYWLEGLWYTFLRNRFRK